VKLRAVSIAIIMAKQSVVEHRLGAAVSAQANLARRSALSEDDKPPLGSRAKTCSGKLPLPACSGVRLSNLCQLTSAAVVPHLDLSVNIIRLNLLEVSGFHCRHRARVAAAVGVAWAPQPIVHLGSLYSAIISRQRA